ncbi:TPA: hypothetical protein HA351_12605 [Methanosarcinaceae archaeon]|nr:hypothetical protein [Methanosarcinaceae archaeon]
MGSEEKLEALETMGRILIFTPLTMGLLNFIMEIWGKGPDLGSEAGYSGVLMVNTGIITLLYASVHRFREGVRQAESGKS